jgi:hypothetical protein
MLDDPARAIEPEDVHRGVAEIVRPRRDVRMRHHEIALRDRALDVDVKVGEQPLEELDEGDERLGTVLRERVVLRVELVAVPVDAHVFLDGEPRFAVVERQRVVRNGGSHVAIELRLTHGASLVIAAAVPAGVSGRNTPHADRGEGDCRQCPETLSRLHAAPLF